MNLSRIRLLYQFIRIFFEQVILFWEVGLVVTQLIRLVWAQRLTLEGYCCCHLPSFILIFIVFTNPRVQSAAFPINFLNLPSVSNTFPAFSIFELPLRDDWTKTVKFQSKLVNFKVVLYNKVLHMNSSFREFLRSILEFALFSWFWIIYSKVWYLGDIPF